MLGIKWDQCMDAASFGMEAAQGGEVLILMVRATFQGKFSLQNQKIPAAAPDNEEKPSKHLPSPKSNSCNVFPPFNNSRQ